MGNPHPSSEQEKVQRLSLLRGVGIKRSRSGFAVLGYANGEDIVCACIKVQEVHKRTA